MRLKIPFLLSASVAVRRLAACLVLGLLWMTVRPGAPPVALGQTVAPKSPPSVEDFQLPPKSVFDRAMPRYPNAWFYVDAALVASQADAVSLVTGNLREAMRLREFREQLGNAEGCDFEARLEHLQPWEDGRHRALQHAHAFHIRYYHSALARHQLEKVTLETGNGKSSFFRFAASVHYEVEHTNPNHADVEICPICGRTGEYKDLQGNLVELVHDPLGLELLLSGTIRGQTVRFDDYDQQEVGSIARLQKRFSVEHRVFPAQAGDRNTLRVGVVIIRPTGKK